MKTDSDVATHDPVLASAHSEKSQRGAKSGASETLPSHFNGISELTSQAKKIADCESFFKEKKRAETLLNQPADYYSDFRQKALDTDLAVISRNLRDLEEVGACDGVNAKSIAGTIYPLLLEAANLGDADAASCYVEARFDLTDEQLAPEQLDVYRENALRFIRDGLQRGDWRFVELMWITASHSGVSHRGRDSHSWLRRLIPPDPELAYEYQKLLRLGATGDLSATLDQDLAASATKFSPEDLQRMDKWAQEQFSHYFSASPTVDALPQTCPM